LRIILEGEKANKIESKETIFFIYSIDIDIEDSRFTKNLPG